MALVSGLYRMAPGTPVWSPEDRERRLRQALRRVATIYGVETVVARIRDAEVPEGRRLERAWLLRAAEGMRLRSR